ncbi:MAG: BrnT family toxin [Pyrinomonadaceae bacterium]|nr:BrnT family toxin [Pyrinomonadaceae bacterium]
MPIFEWDEEKEKSNFRKHKVTFAEGESVFYDSFSLTIPDPDHSIEEQ